MVIDLNCHNSLLRQISWKGSSQQKHAHSTPFRLAIKHKSLHSTSSNYLAKSCFHRWSKNSDKLSLDFRDVHSLHLYPFISSPGFMPPAYFSGLGADSNPTQPWIFLGDLRPSSSLQHRLPCSSVVRTDGWELCAWQSFYTMHIIFSYSKGSIKTWKMTRITKSGFDTIGHKVCSLATQKHLKQGTPGPLRPEWLLNMASWQSDPVGF